MKSLIVTTLLLLLFTDIYGIELKGVGLEIEIHGAKVILRKNNKPVKSGKKLLKYGSTIFKSKVHANSTNNQKVRIKSKIKSKSISADIRELDINYNDSWGFNVTLDSGSESNLATIKQGGKRVKYFYKIFEIVTPPIDYSQASQVLTTWMVINQFYQFISNLEAIIKPPDFTGEYHSKVVGMYSLEKVVQKWNERIDGLTYIPASKKDHWKLALGPWFIDIKSKLNYEPYIMWLGPGLLDVQVNNQVYVEDLAKSGSWLNLWESNDLVGTKGKQHRNVRVVWEEAQNKAQELVESITAVPYGCGKHLNQMEGLLSIIFSGSIIPYRESANPQAGGEKNEFVQLLKSEMGAISSLVKGAMDKNRCGSLYDQLNKRKTKNKAKKIYIKLVSQIKNLRIETENALVADRFMEHWDSAFNRFSTNFDYRWEYSGKPIKPIKIGDRIAIIFESRYKEAIFNRGFDPKNVQLDEYIKSSWRVIRLQSDPNKSYWSKMAILNTEDQARALYEYQIKRIYYQRTNNDPLYKQNNDNYNNLLDQLDK